MDTTQFHTQYAASMAAFLSQLPDPGLRIAVRQQGDPFFRQCALAVWQAGGTPLSPAHTAWYNALYSGSVRPPDVLFWALTAQAGGCTALPAPPTFPGYVPTTARPATGPPGPFWIPWPPR